MPSKYLNDARTGELIQKIYTADRAIATECKSYTDTNYLPLAGGTLTGAVNGVTPTAGDESTKLATTEYVREEVRQHSGIPIGHIYFSVNPNIPQGSLPLFGGEFSRETYSDLWAWVQQQAGYCKTEAEWQALATNNNNNVPYYSDGDGSTTFRVPSLRCWVKGADGTVVEVGSYLAAGLPNITGKFGNTTWIYAGSGDGGAFVKAETAAHYAPGVGNGIGTDYNFSASNSNSIYGNSATVQPPSIVGMWLVKAYGTIEDTGSIDEQQYIDDRMADLKNVYLPANYFPLSGGTLTGRLTLNDQSTRFTSKYATLQNDYSNNGGYIAINGGNSDDDGSRLVLYGQNYSGGAADGGFYIRAKKENTSKVFEGRVDGSLTWDGKTIERINSQNNTLTAGGAYIRYESGLQICYGGTAATTSGVQITFSAAFITTPRVIVSSVNANGYGSVSSDTATGFKLHNSYNNAYTNWIAVGIWK